MEETSGLSERRATLFITIILVLTALWAFTNKYLPLDAALWTLQADLLHSHISGQSTGSPVAWKFITYPAANVAGPLVSAILSFLFAPEVAVRLLLTLGAILLRGLGILRLFRSLRVHDDTIYYLVPVLTLGGVWFAGALPYLLAEAVAVWVLAFFLSQEYPRGSAFWTMCIGLTLIALFHALVFLVVVLVVILVMLEQQRAAHLGQGWLTSPKAVLSLMVPGVLVILLSLLNLEPIFRFSTSNLVPTPGYGRLIFFLTPAPDVLEATFKYGDILHGLLTALYVVVVLGCFVRAFLLAIEEVTWRSRAVRTAGYLLLILALLGPLLSGIGFETSATINLAIALILGGSYSRGPAVRRTPLDRLLFLGSAITLIATLALNGFSLYAGSAAAHDVIARSRTLVGDDRRDLRDNQHIAVREVRFILDSTLAQDRAEHSVGTLSYAQTSSLYLFGSNDLLRSPGSYQPAAGCVRTEGVDPGRISPARQMHLASADLYADSTVRILAALPPGVSVSHTFGPFDLTLIEDNGLFVRQGESNYRLAIGKLSPGRPVEMAALTHF
jgi:hypothetical protein